MLKRCQDCLMAETKPGIYFNEQGICQACVRYKLRATVDWTDRMEQLKKLAGKYKRDDGYYDSIIAVSGGKDSTFQVYIFKDILGMNPLLLGVGDPFTKTQAGLHNIRNIGEAFNCDLITLQLSPDLVRRMVRVAFEEYGSPTWPIDRAIYAYPIHMAVNMRIPLVVYGENVSWEYGGVLNQETFSAKDQINNSVAKSIDWEFWFKRGFSKREINMLSYPAQEEIQAAGLEPIYLSYFIPWDGHRNYQIARRHGFRDLTHEWKREGYIEDYDQIDSMAYLMNVWLKYPKYGFARATDVVGYWIRSGRITRDEGIRLIKEHDHKLDQKVLQDFLNFTGYTVREFWTIASKYFNTEIFDNINGQWILRDSI